MINTDRLIIEPLSYDDAKRFSEYRDKKEVAKYQSWHRYSYNQAKKRINQCLKYPLTNKVGNYQLGIYTKYDHYLIGDLYIEVDGYTTFSLGYTLDSHYWHYGYGREAVKAILNYMYETYQFKRCLCRVYQDNRRSIHLLEKLGFKRISQSKFFQDALYAKDLNDNIK